MPAILLFILLLVAICVGAGIVVWVLKQFPIDPALKSIATAIAIGGTALVVLYLIYQKVAG